MGNSYEYGYGIVNLAKAIGLDNEEINHPNPDEITAPVTPPAEPSMEPSYINQLDSQFLTLSKKLLKLKEYALETKNTLLAKEIEQKYHDLLIVNVELHKLPETIKSAQSVQKDVYVSKNGEIEEYYQGKDADFKKLGKTYNHFISEFENQLSVEDTQRLYQQNEVDSLSTCPIYLDTPIDVDLPPGESQVYSFTATKTGMHKIFTGPYGGTGTENDTILELYSDANLTNLIKQTLN